MFKKLLFSFLALIILTMGFAPYARAKDPDPSPPPASPGPWYNQSYDQWLGKVYGGDQNEIFGERYTAAQVRWVLYGLLAVITNPTGDKTIGDCEAANATGDATACGKGMIDLYNSVSSMFKINSDDQNKNVVSMIFEDRGFSGISYVKNLARKFNLIPTANAQTAGFGYTGALGEVADIQYVWTIVRNLSYAIFVVIIIAFAFMIMFRVKISPQVVITVQSALPKIAITLVLVTFSYAIAGFLIDIMYIVIGILSLIFSQITVAGVGFAFGGGSPAGAVSGYFSLLTTGPTFLFLRTGIFGLLIMYLVNYIIAYLVIVFGGLVGFFGGAGGVGGGLISVLSVIIGAIGLVVVIIMGIINFFRIVMLLARTFVTIILLTIFAPLQLTIGAVVPGMGFGAWVKSFASKLAVFPAVGAMFIIALWLLQIGVDIIISALGLGGHPKPISFAQGWPPLLGASPQMLALTFLLASIAVFLMIPSVSKMIESFMAGKGFAGVAIGEAMGPVRSLGTTGLNIAGSPSDIAAKSSGGSPYMQGGTRQRIGYAIGQLTKAIVNSRG